MQHPSIPIDTIGSIGGTLFFIFYINNLLISMYNIQHLTLIVYVDDTVINFTEESNN